MSEETTVLGNGILRWRIFVNGWIIGLVSLGLAGERPAAAEAQKRRNVRVAMCQTLCVDGDREGNFRRIEAALKEAAKGRAEIACFPETAILGWVNPEAHKSAHAIPGKDTERLARLAKEHGLMVCIGLAEKDGERLFDSVVLIDKNGQVVSKHRKMNTLTELMDPPYTRGKSIDTVETEFGRIGMLICADTFENKTLEAMRDLKPDLVLVPYGWAAKPEEWPGHGDSLRDTVSRAAKTIGAPVIGTDLMGEITHGPWTGRTYGGQSVACSSEGTVLMRGKDREAQVLILDVALDRKSAEESQ